MSIKSIFFRFTAVYALSMIVIGFVVSFLELENASSFNTPILIVIAFWCFTSYSKSNKRISSSKEKWKIIWLFLLGDILVSVLLATPLIITSEVPLRFFLIGFAIAMPLHLIMLMGVDFIVRKQLTKQGAFVE
ncbi:MAG: ABZJ_00895 family protein [Pseudomonadales bacterium]|nr:ABZJ_00895 family protein [Pseudomonadales bacterium]